MTKVEQQQERQEWGKRIAAYRASGLSTAEWCAGGADKNLDSN